MQNLLSLIKDLTLHPQNISELKGLILQLAIQGKLTQKWREENPELVSGSNSASALLEQIQEEKERLIKEKVIRKEKPLPEITHEDKPYELPDGWEWCRLGSYIHNFGQITPASDFTYIDVGSIDNENGVIKNPTILSSDEAPSRARKVVQKGSVIYSTVRPYLLNIAVIDRDFVPTPIASTAFAVMNPLIGCSSEYLYHYLRSQVFIDYVNSQMIGVAYPAINDKKLLEGLISIPPLEEQKAIVRIVDDLFKEVDELAEQVATRTQLKEDYVTSACRELTENTQATWRDLVPLFPEFFDTKPNIKKLRETILQLAVQGKLTTSWRACHPELSSPEGGGGADGGGIESASALLKRIQAEKEQLIKEKKIKREKPLPEISEKEKPYELPDGWEWCRWVDLLGNVKYPMKRGPFGSSLRKDDFVAEGIRVFEQYNPINDDPHWMRYFITYEKYESMQAFTAESSDFLVSCSGATLGRIVYLPEGTIPGIINQALLKLNLSKDIMLPDYFLKLFRSMYIQSLIWQKAQGMAQPNMVGVKELKSILIPLPPLEEQKAIVEKVNALMSLCDQLEKAVETSESFVLDLMKSVVREATASDKTSKVSMRPYKDLGGLESESIAAEEGGEYG